MPVLQAMTTPTTLSLDVDSHLAPTLAIARQLAKVYWQRLVKAGISVDEAMEIAIAIARFDVVNKRPNTKYRNLIGRHCPAICRAELWRPGLLL